MIGNSIAVTGLMPVQTGLISPTRTNGGFVIQIVQVQQAEPITLIQSSAAPDEALRVGR